MTRHSPLPPAGADSSAGTILKLAILAVGGQGGGVLTGWIETLARSQGYTCQATSVAGVAQRTGATIYYVEMAPQGPRPVVFSLAPTAGDVDIMIAAEMMEAGRAIQRGFVTPDRTTLIASTHRALAVSEKMVPGDGIASSDEVRAAAEIAAERLVLFDMDALALRNGSVISSALFGALAGSGALPFPRAAFEEAIRGSGKGVDASLRAFGAAYEAAANPSAQAQAPAPTGEEVTNLVTGPADLVAGWTRLQDRLATHPTPLRDMALRGLRKVVAFQDLAYGGEYLDRLDPFLQLDRDSDDHALGLAAAKHLANAMAYDDVIRVAEVKTRAGRMERIAEDMNAADRTLELTEFLHPRAAEIAGLLPAGLGRRVESSPVWMDRLDRWFGHGRRMRTHRLADFLQLYVLGGMRSYRRRSWRHRVEQAHLDRWLDLCLAAARLDRSYGAELLRCRRLIKGYSDTHARGLSKFDRVIATAQRLQGRDDAAAWVARLRDAALKDEKGQALDGAIRTVDSFL